MRLPFPIKDGNCWEVNINQWNWIASRSSSFQLPFPCRSPCGINHCIYLATPHVDTSVVDVIDCRQILWTETSWTNLCGRLVNILPWHRVNLSCQFRHFLRVPSIEISEMFGKYLCACLVLNQLKHTECLRNPRYANHCSLKTYTLLPRRS